MGLRDRAQTPPADDQFFRQLAGEAPVDAQGAPPAPENPQPEASTSGPIDPHAAHPIAQPLPTPGHGRKAPRRDADRRRPSDSEGGLRRRAIAAIALGLGVLAAATVVVGAGPGERASAEADPRGVPNGSPAAEDARLRAWWASDGRTHRRERWRRDAEAMIAGRLMSEEAGEPIAGATVTILAADATRRGAINRTVGEVRTDEEGRFTAAIAVDEGAPRKRLTLSYLARARDTAPAATARAELAVTSPITLQADQSRIDRGESMRLDGRSAPDARVTVIAHAPGSGRWQLLDDVRADPEGNWQATVNAPRDTSPGDWRFRAVVAESRDDGYLGARSDQVRVEVDE
ncbi:MAG: carboxypeptidase-like regulatory domain-containing protein [Solirubrobacteraceae bacterium MAG38_C4-C5]|nr:carboxypeptidase-like regulatory domain-containing protein [Candidatus Siliceabacter maunaloa]